MLRDFDKTVASTYANTEGRDTRDIRAMLVALVMTSLLSACANVLGRSFFAGDDRLLIIIATVFAAMLFILSYLAYTRNFSFEDLSADTEELPGSGSGQIEEELSRKIDEVMVEKKLFLEKGLKISDLALQVGACRTYVSHCINSTKGEQFSDYVNRLRIDHAKTILQKDDSIKNIVLAEQLGFTNEQSFYRNFKKFTGMTPAEWKKASAPQR